MKFLIYILFTFLFSLCYASSDDTLKYNLANDFGYFYSNSHSINYTGENVFHKKKYQLSLNTSYACSFSKSQIDQNELLNKTSLAYNNFFVNHIFNISYSRKIHYENFLGIGYIYRFKKIPISLSYAILGQHRQYYFDSVEYKLRHSIRLKFKLPIKKVATLSFECYYQPNFFKSNDYIIYGSTKLLLFEDRKINISFSDNMNYQSLSSVKMVHSFSIGVGFNVEKK